MSSTGGRGDVEADVRTRLRAVKASFPFTDKALSSLRYDQAGKKQQRYWDEGCSGLSVLVGPRTKTFFAQYKYAGEWRSVAIGRFGEMVPDDDKAKQDVQTSAAREIVRDYRAKGRNSIDPLKPSPQALSQSTTTYEEIVAQFIEEYAKPRQHTWDQTERVLLQFESWLTRPFNSIEKSDALAELKVFIRQKKVYKAEKARAWLRKLWKWAWENDLIATNVMDSLKIEFEKRERNRVFCDDEVRAIWAASDKLDFFEAAYIKLIVLLAPRKTALAAARRIHFLEDATIWQTPHELTKSKKTSKKKRVYRTPLPPLAQSIIKSVLKRKDNPDLIFPTLAVYRQKKSGRYEFSSSRLARKLVKAGAPQDVQFHAWRHTITTFLGDNGRSDWEQGLVLNHSHSGTVTSGYNHGHPTDLLRSLYAEWGDHVRKLITAKPRTQVLKKPSRLVKAARALAA